MRIEDRLTRRARCHHAVEAISREFCAAQPLYWDGDAVTLLFHGRQGIQGEIAFRAAEAILNRLWVDLAVGFRCAVHSVTLGTDEPEPQTSVFAQISYLESIGPENSILATDDVYLVLPDDVRANLALLGFPDRYDLPVYVFPADAATQAIQSAFRRRGDLELVSAFRKYASGPRVRMLSCVGYRSGGKGPPLLDIDDVFVAPRVRVIPQDEARPPRGLESTQEIDEFLANRPIALLIGGPGCGKTTLLRWLAVRASRSSDGLGLPLFANMGRLAVIRKDLGTAASMPAVLARYFQEERIAESTVLSGFIAQQLAAGTCLMLLDGLDEAPGEERAGITDWLGAFARANPGNRIVATARDSVSVERSLPGAVTARILPWEDEHVDRFVRSFVAAYGRWEGNADLVSSAASDRLRKEIRSSALAPLLRTPLLLTGIVLAYRSEGSLARQRVLLFEVLSRTLCESWARVRRGSGGADSEVISYDEEAVPILGELAIRMHEACPTGRAPKAFVIRALAEVLGRRRCLTEGEGTSQAESFLRTVAEGTRILEEMSPGEWGFTHLSFQEFFAAAGLHASESFAAVAKRHLLDPRWEEVICLGVGYLALVQKRPKAALEFIVEVVNSSLCPERPWVVEVLRKHVGLVGLLATECGGALEKSSLRKLAGIFVPWCAAIPSSYRENYVQRIRSSEFGHMVVEVCIQQLKDVSPVGVLRLLVNLGSPEALDAVVEAMQDPRVYVRDAAIRELHGFQIPAAIAMIPRLLQDEDFVVRWALTLVLPSWIGKDAIPPLSRLLEDSEEMVREGAAESLASFGEALPAELRERVASLASRPSACPTDSEIESLEDARRVLLDDRDDSRRREAVEAVMTLGEKRLLILAAMDQADEVSSLALKGLFEGDDPSGGMSLVIRSLQGDDPQIVAAAAGFLGVTANSEAFDFDAAVRALLECLKSIEYRPPWHKDPVMLTSEDSLVRDAVLEALWRFSVVAFRSGVINDLAENPDSKSRS